MSDTNDHAEDDAPPDPATRVTQESTTRRLADALRPPLPPGATRAIITEMNKVIGSWGRDYASTIVRIDPSPIASEITASIQSTATDISVAVLNLGERVRSVDIAEIFEVDMPKISELIEIPEFPVPKEISEAARRFTESIQPYTGGGFGSHMAAGLGSGRSELSAGFKLDLPPLGSSMSDVVLSTISRGALFGDRNPERMLGLGAGSFLPADSPLLNIKPFGGGHEVLGVQLAQYVPSGAVFHAMRRWMPSESIAESLSAWWRLADQGLSAARVALGEALGLVAALQRGDVDATERVKRFLVTWLRFRDVSMDLVASAVLVLLNPARWLPAELHNFDPRKKLRTRILVEHRKATRLSTDPELRFRGHPLRSLQEPIGDDGEAGTVVVLGDRVADPRAVDPAEQLPDEFAHPGMRELWWKLTDRERSILRARGQPGVTWAEAAVECGGTPADGEALRRKAKRLSKRDLASEHSGRAVS